MATELKLRRDVEGDIDAMTPAEGEPIYDITNKRLRMGDGSTAGGIHLGASADHQKQTFVHAAASGTDTLTLTLDPPIASYTTGLKASFKAANNNTGTVTIAINGLSAKTIKKNAGADDLVANDLVSGGIYNIEYDGTNFQIDRLVGAGVTSISNVAITAVANIDITGFLPGTYDNYEVWISNGQPANDGVILILETSTDGGSTFDVGASDYTWAVLFTSEGATPSADANADDAQIQFTGDISVGNAANENVSVKLCLYDPGSAEFSNFTWQAISRGTTTALSHYTGSGDRQATADVDGLRFSFGAGNWVAQGKIQFLGIVK